ncbi:MAG: tRNA pseudouridine55 synthase [Parasphingorhabdus sp.]|jgi:tRNA pseudouridine55 synthase
MGKFQSGRQARQKGDPVTGMLLLDKPDGVSSNGALQIAKRLLNARKGGHTGSLDPIATGLLPLCFGEATKAASFFLNADKSYWARIRLGQTTATGDREGDVLEDKPLSVTKQQILSAMDSFRGEFEQIPPMFSAIKKQGQPLYKLARQGIEIEREPRPVNVYELNLSAIDLPFIDIEMTCSRGFYVRSLAMDLGEALGCGGHVQDLRRTGVGDLKLEDAVTLAHLEGIEGFPDRRENLISADLGLGHLPRIDLSVDATFYLVRGQSVRANSLPKSGWVRLYCTESGFLGLGEVTDDGKVSPKRLFRSHVSRNAA